MHLNNRSEYSIKPSTLYPVLCILFWKWDNIFLMWILKSWQRQNFCYDKIAGLAPTLVTNGLLSAKTINTSSFLENIVTLGPILYGILKTGLRYMPHMHICSCLHISSSVCLLWHCLYYEIRPVYGDFYIWMVLLYS